MTPSTAAGSARVELYQDSWLTMQMTVDLATGAPTTINQLGVTGVEVQSSTAFGARESVIFFAPTQNATAPDLGIDPADASLGAALVATDVRLLNVDSYCAP